MTLDELRSMTDVPVVLADHNGVITQVNAQFETVFGWAAKDIVGRSLTAIIPSGLHDAHHLGFSRFVTTGRPTLLNQPLTLRAVTKDGREFEAEHVIAAEQRSGQWQFGASIRPLAGRG